MSVGFRKIGFQVGMAFAMTLTLAHLSFGKTKAKASACEQKFAAPVRPVSTVSLNEILAPGKRIADDQIYGFTNAHGETYRLKISHEILKEAKKGQEATIKRLLSALTRDATGQHGIKFLSSTGKNIVEVKTVMHGHRRLIGCLVGRELYLWKLMDLPDSVAAYNRLIPSHLCDSPR